MTPDTRDEDDADGAPPEDGEEAREETGGNREETGVDTGDDGPGAAPETVDALRGDIAALRADLDDLEALDDDVSALEADVNALESDVADVESALAELASVREDLDALETRIDERTVHRDDLEGELRRYVRKRVRRGHATGWGPYLVLLYGTVMTVGAFYYLGDPWAILAMILVWLSTLGLFVFMLVVGSIVGVGKRLAGLRDLAGKLR